MGDAAQELNVESMIRFEEGVIGVPRARRFELMERPDSPLRILRCLDIEGFNLPVIDPRRVDPVYRPKLAERVIRLLEATDNEPLLLLAVTTIKTDGAEANLKAPVVVNVARRTAVQVILEGDYPLCAPVDLTESVTT